MLKKLRLDKEDTLQYEFMPVALEVIEKPASPKGKYIIYLIFAILIAAIIWAYVGKVDIIAISQGKIVPVGYIKVVQPLEEGKIIGIHVTEGQKVLRNDLLIELDSTLKNIDIAYVEEQIKILNVEKDLLNKYLKGENLQQLTMDAKLPSEMKDNLLKLIRAKEDEYQSKRRTANLTVEQAEDELKMVREDIKRIKKNVEGLKTREESLQYLSKVEGIEEQSLTKLRKELEIRTMEAEKYARLYQAGAVSRNEWQQKVNEVTLLEEEIKIQETREKQEQENKAVTLNTVSAERSMTENSLQSQLFKEDQAVKKLEEAKNILSVLEKQRDLSILDLVVEKEKALTEQSTLLGKAVESKKFQNLVAPVSGTVHGLVSNTVGGIVTPAETLMTIVPDGTQLVVEAMLLNKDAGFVQVGQKVEVKLDAFSFQKYGVVHGTVQNISPDAFEDGNLGAVYKMTVSLEDNSILVGSKEERLFPGMTATAEIKVGERRIIEFFLDPLIEHVDDTLKLR